MGRSASHIALECALQTQPNICLISEEIQAKDMTLNQIVEQIASAVAKRAEEGNNFGVVLIPEGLIEFIPAIGRLIDELNDLLAAHGNDYKNLDKDAQREYIIAHLSKENAETFATLPEGVARQLSLDRDPHGNVQVSLIETEKLISDMVGAKLAEWKKSGKYNGKFAAQHHFFGYEGRCAAPSNFDADYCYALGVSAANLIANGKTGYMAIVKNPVIRKALVELDGAPFKAFAAHRDEWANNTCFVYPGPIQYWGPAEVCDRDTRTLSLENAEKNK